MAFPVTIPLSPLTSSPGDQPRRVRVVVVGAGGIGARVLPTLVKMLPTDGRSEVLVIDPDIVEPKNIRRQPFGPENVGEYKAVVMQDRYSSEAVPVTAVTEKFRPNSPIFRGTESLALFVLGCVDNTAARYQMLYAMSSLTSPSHVYLDAGNDGNRGQVIVGFGKVMSNNPDFGTLYHALSAVDKFPEVFASADPKPEGCDLLDTQTPMANQMAATFLLQYLSLFLHGQMLGSLGVTFSTLGATDRIPLVRLPEYRGYAQYAASAFMGPDTYQDLGLSVRSYVVEAEGVAKRKAHQQAEDERVAAEAKQAVIVPPPVPIDDMMGMTGLELSAEFQRRLAALRADGLTTLPATVIDNVTPPTEDDDF